MGLMAGRTAVVFGVANKRSIAWAIAQKMHEAGAHLILGYQNERLKQEVDSLLTELPAQTRSSATCRRMRRLKAHLQL